MRPNSVSIGETCVIEQKCLCKPLHFCCISFSRLSQLSARRNFQTAKFPVKFSTLFVDYRRLIWRTGLADIPVRLLAETTVNQSINRIYAPIYQRSGTPDTQRSVSACSETENRQSSTSCNRNTVIPLKLRMSLDMGGSVPMGGDRKWTVLAKLRLGGDTTKFKSDRQTDGQNYDSI